MSGIKITKAMYGSGSQTVDVTSAVTSNLKDGQVNLVVTPDSLNVADPAPGQPKQLTVTYTINNGKANTESVQENGVLSISAPPMREANGLSIVNAQYGYDGNFTDVTNAVQTLVDDGSINVKVSASAFGIPDPNPSKAKKLKVEYTLNGSTNTDEIPDGTTFKLSAPPTTQKDTTRPTDYVKQLIGIIFSNMSMFVGMLLYTVSMFATADFFEPAPIISSNTTAEIKQTYTDIFKSAFGTSQGRTRLLYLGLGGILPGVAYWGLPVYVFWRRLFSNSYTL